MNREKLVFDLGGVLVVNSMFAELGELTGGLAQGPLKTKWLQSAAVRKFELGLCTPEEFSTAMVAEFRLTISPSEFLAAFSGWPKGLYPGAESLLKNLRANNRIGCLSNSNQVHWVSNITAHFDFSYSSHLMQQIKPDVAVFDYVTDKLDCLPTDVVFFDDSMLNVAAAREFGWQAHLTDGYDELNRVLRELSLI